MSKLRVRDLMTPVVHVVHPDDPLATVRDVMSEKHIRHVPVVDDDGDIVGLVSERDLLRKAAGLEGEVPLSVSDEVAAGIKVREVMNWHVETIEADDEAATAAAVMLENKYGCLPVLEQGVLAGILTEADFVRHVAEGTVASASTAQANRCDPGRAGGWRPGGIDLENPNVPRRPPHGEKWKRSPLDLVGQLTVYKHIPHVVSVRHVSETARVRRRQGVPEGLSVLLAARPVHERIGKKWIDHHCGPAGRTDDEEGEIVG